jgi:hypothetical protein
LRLKVSLEETLKKTVAIIAGLSVIACSAAWASTASQREYERGFADCSAGKYDEYQHGLSYKAGCDAASAQRDSTGAAPAAGAAAPVSGASPVTQQQVTAYIDASVPGKDKQACIRALRKQGGSASVVVIGAVGSEANNQVTLGLGPQRAPWRCLVKRGKVVDLMSQTDEGAL